MTERELGIRKAEVVAKALNKRFGVRCAGDIKVTLYPAALGVKVVEGKLEGATAMLSMGRKPTIRVSDRPCQPGEREFWIGHELGHHVLDHVPARVDAACKSGKAYRPVRQGNARHFEAEANTVAAGLCLPSELLAKPIAAARPSLDMAHAIAKEYTMPITATAIRVAELSPYSCAAIYSEAGKIVWGVSSTTFPTRYWRGRRVAPDSVPFEYVQSGKLEERERTRAGDGWLGASEEVVEHSTIVPGTQGVITLLWIPSRPRTG